MTSKADSKIPTWSVWIFIAGARVVERSLSTFSRARFSSRRTDIHSAALRLLCWKKRRSGVERSREVYCRWSCDLRNSGGLCDGGWVGGKRAIGGGEEIVWGGGAAGVIAEAVERYLYELGWGLRRC